MGNTHFSVIETPGHTKGSVCYLINGYLFSGDTLFYKAHGKTDIFGGSDSEIKESLLKLARLDDNIIVYPGHLTETTIGNEKKSGILERST